MASMTRVRRNERGQRDHDRLFRQRFRVRTSVREEHVAELASHDRVRVAVLPRARGIATFRRKKPFLDDRSTDLGARTRR